MYVPSADYEWFSETILQFTTGWYNDSQYGPVTSCDEEDLMKKVYFLLKGADDKDYWAEWLPEDYLIEIGDTKEC